MPERRGARAAVEPRGAAAGPPAAPFRLGRISYINVLPLYYHLAQVWEQSPGGPPFALEVTAALPSALNALLAEGALGLSPVSSIELAHHPERYRVVDGLSIHSIGPVQSVVLVSRVPIDRLDGRRVGRTMASATSRVLLNVLLSQEVGVRPVYHDVPAGVDDPLADCDAALLIGDAALQYRTRSNEYRYDLGELWYRATRAPMVFAVWAVRADAPAQRLEEARTVARALQRSLELSRGNMAAVVREACSQVDMSEAAAAAYFRYLRYDLDGVAVGGLQLFFDCAARAGDIPRAPRLSFLGR